MPPQRSKKTACLQCRTQKLKCERSVMEDTGPSPCLRCARTDRICRPSPSSRLGRPPQATGQWNMVWEYAKTETQEPSYDPYIPPIDWNMDISSSPEGKPLQNRHTCTSSIITPILAPSQDILNVTVDPTTFLGTGVPSKGIDKNDRQSQEQDANSAILHCPTFHLGSDFDRKPEDEIVAEIESPKTRDLVPGSLQTMLGDQFSLLDASNLPGCAELTATVDDASNNNIQALSVLLSRLCKGLDKIKNEGTSPIDLALGCAEDFVSILDKTKTSSFSADEDIIQEIFGTTQSIQEANSSPAVDMPVILLILSCYVKILTVFCALFADCLKPSSPTSLSQAQQGLSWPETCFKGLPCWQFGLQNRGIQMAILVQLVQYTTSRAESVLKLGVRDPTASGLIQATMDSDEVQQNSSALANYIKKIKTALGCHEPTSRQSRWRA